MKEAHYKNYLIVVLLVILAFNYVDRLALGLLMQDIKLDLDLTDTELGLLSGIAFALFYSIMGIPIARWADRGDRVKIITITTALWSLAVALCGFTANFLQLALVRVGVAVGEAGCVPPAHSLIASHFDRAERPRAVSRYMLGTPLSLIIGYFAAGWLNELYGWRITFMLLGLPGLGLAALAWFTLREPRRPLGTRAYDAPTRKTDAQSTDDEPPRGTSPEPTLMEVCSTLWRNVTFRHLLLGFSVASFFGYGIVQWKAAFFMRSFGLETGELGTWFALIYGVFGSLGAYLSGEWASRLAPNNERLQLRSMAVAYGVFAAISCAIYLSTSLAVAFSLLALATIGIYAINGPLFAIIQTLVPERMRAMSVALILFFSNLIGLGFGPLAAGALSDALRPSTGEESLRYALLILCPGYLWAAWHIWRAGQTIGFDLAPAALEPETASETSTNAGPI